MPVRHGPRREDPQDAAITQVLQSPTHGLDVSLRRMLTRKGINGKNTLSNFRDTLQEVIGHDDRIRSHLPKHVKKENRFHASKGMIRHNNARPLTDRL